MRSFIDSDSSDTDNFVPFENTVPICWINKKVKIKERRAVFYFDLFISINQSVIFERYRAVSVR